MTDRQRVFVDGLACRQPRISVFDRGLQFGEAALETIGAWDGHLVAPAAHLERLRRSLDALGLGRIRVAPDDLLDQARRLAEHLGDGAIKILVTSGAGRGHLVETPSRPTRIVMHRPLAARALPSLVAGDLAAVYPLGPVKTLFQVSIHLAARRRAAGRGDDVLLFSPAGDLAEASTSNVFVLAGDRWWTPAGGMLPGVTRALFLRYLADLGECVTVGRVGRELLEQARAIVLTNSAVGALAASSWLGRRLEAPACVDRFRSWVLARDDDPRPGAG